MYRTVTKLDDRRDLIEYTMPSTEFRDGITRACPFAVPEGYVQCLEWADDMHLRMWFEKKSEYEKRMRERLEAARRRADEISPTPEPLGKVEGEDEKLLHEWEQMKVADLQTLCVERKIIIPRAVLAKPTVQHLATLLLRDHLRRKLAAKETHV